MLLGRPARTAVTVALQRLRLPTGGPAAVTVTAAHRRLARAGMSVPVRLWDGAELGPSDRSCQLVLRKEWSLRAGLGPLTDRQLGEAHVHDVVDVEGSMVAAIADLPSHRETLGLICRKLRLGPGDRLLDIGCGWGSLLIHAARQHAVVGVGVTLWERQAELARQRVGAAGLAGQVEIRLQDYRSVSGEFDAVASVGLFEHVGGDQLASYFRACLRLTRPGRRFLNHGSTTGRRAVVREMSKESDSFVGGCVLPDGALVPTHVAVTQLEPAGFELVDVEQLRPHYARTLEHRVRLEANAESARRLVGEEVYRIWRAYYMTEAALGFDSGDLGVVQILGTRGDAGLTLGRAWMLPPEPAGPGGRAQTTRIRP